MLPNPWQKEEKKKKKKKKKKKEHFNSFCIDTDTSVLKLMRRKEKFHVGDITVRERKAPHVPKDLLNSHYIRRILTKNPQLFESNRLAYKENKTFLQTQNGTLNKPYALLPLLPGSLHDNSTN
jgi:hypothetical protein